jgi:hypothetical protein
LIFIKLPSKFPEKYTRCASFQISNRIKASCIFRPTLSFKFEKIFERINKFLKEKKVRVRVRKSSINQV